MRKCEADDFVADLLDRVTLKVAIDTRDLEREIRRDWGGCRPYIGKSRETSKQELCARDVCIRNDARRGEHIALLSRRYGITERRVRQIIGTGNGLP